MASIASALGRIKDDPRTVLSSSAIESVCRDLGLQWRHTPLSPPNTLALFIQQIVHGNVSCAQAVRLGRLGVTPQAYCEARQRLPVEAIETLAARVFDAAAVRRVGVPARTRPRFRRR